jgi:hypothetical protein
MSSGRSIVSLVAAFLVLASMGTAIQAQRRGGRPQGRGVRPNLAPLGIIRAIDPKADERDRTIETLLVANADAVEGNDAAPYHDSFALDRIEQALHEGHEATQAQPRLPRAERGANMLYAAQASSKALRRVTEHIPKGMPKERLSQQVEIALASFKGGVCVSANLDIGQFDSHANNDPDQMRLIPEFLAGIAYLLRRAGELKIRDQLVVVVQSEMGRTPAYNAGNGKDHWSIGSAMFLGRGIKGNRVIGATDEKQFAVPLDPRTLKLDHERGIRVRPEHVHESLRELAGIAEHPLSKKFPFGLADKEKLRGLWG